MEANWGPLSEIKVLWRPNRLKTWSKKSFATPMALMVLLQGMRITPLLSPWSTTTTKESCPFDLGRSVTRSMEIYLKGNRVFEGMGLSGGMVGWVFTLFC